MTDNDRIRQKIDGKRKLKILCAIAHVQNGGGQVTQSVRIMKELEKRHTLRLLTLKVDDRVVDTPKDTLYVGDFSFPKGMLQLAKAVRKYSRDFDVIQSFDGFYSFPAAVLARKRPYFLRMGMDSPSFLAEKGVPLHRAFAWAQMLPIQLGDCEKFIVNSEYLRDIQKKYDPEVIPNGYEIGSLMTSEGKKTLRKKLGLPDLPIFIYTGKIIPRKRLEDALSVLNGRDVCFVGLGEVADKAYFSMLKERFRDDWKKTIFPGEVQVREVAEYLQASDIFIFPSSCEGQPNSVLEAMGAGLPVIASRNRPHEEIIVDGKTGYLFSDVDEMIRRADILLSDEKKRVSMGKEGMEYVRTNHDIRSCADRYEELYWEALR